MKASKMAIHWPDRDLWVARVFRTRSTVLSFIEQYPWAAGVIAVPLTMIGLAGVVMFPFVFGPLLVLLGVALVVIEYYADQQQPVESRTHAETGTRKRNLSTRGGHSTMPGRFNLPQLYTEALARMDAADAKARAADARARAAEAQALAAEAGKQAEVAEARLSQLRHEAKAKTRPSLDID
ncbi:MAG: hypothetical protein K2X52_18260 [Mycobacteriaceae bacterium]|nr:hypothetical protein [Mycobacteriaceae bacterium]